MQRCSAVQLVHVWHQCGHVSSVGCMRMRCVVATQYARRHGIAVSACHAVAVWHPAHAMCLTSLYSCADTHVTAVYLDYCCA